MERGLNSWAAAELDDGMNCLGPTHMRAIYFLLSSQ